MKIKTGRSCASTVLAITLGVLIVSAVYLYWSFVCFAPTINNEKLNLLALHLWVLVNFLMILFFVVSVVLCAIFVCGGIKIARDELVGHTS